MENRIDRTTIIYLAVIGLFFTVWNAAWLIIIEFPFKPSYISGSLAKNYGVTLLQNMIWLALVFVLASYLLLRIYTHVRMWRAKRAITLNENTNLI